MTTPDIITGAFESLAAFAAVGNLRATYRAKRSDQLSLGAMGFFLAWGIWNFYYYPSLNQWAAFAGGVGIVAVNGAWFGLAAYYRVRQRAREIRPY